MSRLTLAVMVLGLATGVAAAAEFPTISIERTCGAAKPLDAQDTSPVETCLQMYGPSSAGASTRTRRKFGQ